jgi:queuine tRNA-ribosyltransferase
MSEFRLIKKCSKTGARLGKLHTRSGCVETPQFMPVGTCGAVKAMTPDEVRDLGATMILANTYHLFVRPGNQLIEAMGGLHRFMNWNGSILTDSGGFQIFSLSEFARISDSGVTFASHLDGTRFHLTPEIVVEIQESLGSDVMMVLDHLVPSTSQETAVKEAVERTLNWAHRSRSVWTTGSCDLWAIVQGGIFPKIRQYCAEELALMDFPGYAIGGLAVGESTDDLYEMTTASAESLPENKPRYLMGVGLPENLVECVARGVDLFDCVIPTRHARNGMLFTRTGRCVIKQAAFRNDPAPPEHGCTCYCCKNFSRAYLRHLYMSGEILAARLATTHNIHYFMSLMKDIRDAVKNNCFPEFRKTFHKTMNDRSKSV